MGPAEGKHSHSEGETGELPVAQWVEDLALLWLWHRPAAAALIRPPAWELPYATGAAGKMKVKLSLNRYL